MRAMSSLRIIYASTSGHTEYVVECLAKELQALRADLGVVVTRVEKARPEDLTSADFLVLASGTWNTGGVEGQLNPHMHDYLKGKAKEVDLDGRHVALIALGDDRYYYTCRAGEHLRQYVMTHGGEVWPNVLMIVNDPYGQEAKVAAWAKKFVPDLPKARSHAKA